jgi:hypothetical protein
MNAEVAYDLYEEPSRWSRVAIVCCIIAVVIFALLVFVPPVLSNLLPTSAPPHHKEIVAPSPAQTIVAITKSARTVSADPAGIAPTTATSTPTTSIAADPSLSMATTTEQAAANPPMPAAAVPSAGNTSSADESVSVATSVATWPTIHTVHTLSPAVPALEADAEPVARPPLPRARPHLTLAGTPAIPLPHPRPFIPTPEATASVPETILERPDYAR